MLRGLITRLERTLAYFPELTLKGTPEHVGLRYEDLWLKTEDGNRVHAWWIPGPDDRPGSQRPTWVFFHGSGGNISARLDGYRAIHRRVGANILTVDYRGFGLSLGKPTELGTYADGRAAVAEAVRRHNRQTLSSNSRGPLVMFGISMGAAIASRLASDLRPDALLLESPPSSFPDLAPLHYPWTRMLPISKIMGFRYETRTHVTNLDVPTLVIHGDLDEVVPMASAQLVFDSANDPKRLHIVKGGTHDRPDLIDEDRYYSVVNDFMQEFAVPNAESRTDEFAAD